MRYSKEHKQETHARIVKRASVKLREHGAHGIGVADLMKEAGLTHGGFYAHFASREALVIEAFAYAMDRSTARWRRKAEETPADQRFATIIDSYLTPLHRDDPGNGCAVPALAAEIARVLAEWDRGAGFARIREDWLLAADGKGGSVTVKWQDGETTGLFEDIDRDGYLLLNVGGQRQRILVGDLFFGTAFGERGMAYGG